MHIVKMPQVGKTKENLTIIRWLKSVGESVGEGELLLEIEATDAMAEVESKVGGTVENILCPRGTTHSIGTPIAEIVDSAEMKTELQEGPVVTAQNTNENSGGVVTPVLMPQAGQSMEEGTIVKWIAKPGDIIKEGDIIFEVETDKAVLEVEAVDSGRLSRVVLEAGETLEVLKPVAYLAENDADVDAFLGSQQTEAAPAKETVAPPGGAVTPVLMPQAGQSMEEGTIVKWIAKPGDMINEGDVIFEVETDKAVLEVEAVNSGKLSRIVLQEGETLEVLKPVAYLAENDADVDAYIASQEEQSTPAEEVVVKEEKETPAAEVASAPAATTDNGRVKASPAARRIAGERGIDLASVGMGSGPGGRIIVADVQSAEVFTGEPVRRRMSGMRKAIARNLLASKQNIPHFYMRLTIDADPLFAFYREEKAKYQCSLNDVILLGCAHTIKEFPAFRSRIDGDDILELPSANIGVAVGMDDGLVVPVVVGADRMSLQGLGAESRRVIEAARGGKIEGMGQGVFTITNLGMFGVEEFSAIVNPPEAAILAVSAVREEVIVTGGAMRPGRVMTMTLSCDHRIIDGLLAAKFLAHLKELLENPESI